jgi:hypothetical protein
MRRIMQTHRRLIERAETAERRALIAERRARVAEHQLRNYDIKIAELCVRISSRNADAYAIACAGVVHEHMQPQCYHHHHHQTTNDDCAGTSDVNRGTAQNVLHVTETT